MVHSLVVFRLDAQVPLSLHSGGIIIIPLAQTTTADSGIKIPLEEIQANPEYACMPAGSFRRH